MKDNSLDGHRGKVALSDTTRLNTSATANNPVGSGIKCELKTTTTTSSANDGSAVTNFDDDNEWELGIGDLIIDLDADIEKTNERNGTTSQQGITSHHHHHSHHHHNGTAPSPGNNSSAIIDSPNSSSGTGTTFNFLGSQLQPPCNNSNLAAGMSNSKTPRSSGVGSGTGGSAGTGVASSVNSGGSSAQGSGTFEHQATVDKGLKMKIKRKTVGSKYSEAKHEIVQSDTKSAPASSHTLSENVNSSNSSNSSASASASNSPATSSDTPKSKHSSSKGRTGSHREKKEKNRDKDKNSNVRSSASTSVPSAEVNGVLGVMSPLKITNSGVSMSSPVPPSLCSNSSPLPSTSVASPSVPRGSTPGTSVANSPTSNSAPEGVSQPPVNLPASSANSPPMPNLTLKLENKFTPSPIPQSCPLSVVVKQEDCPASPPLKKIKLEITDRNGEIESQDSPIPPEMKDTSTCTSVGTITEPDCLGPCEPGTSVMLEGIVWQETEGGVLVVNVTWRGKTYVGTLLDATKHDWAPPRFCESPTSDVDSKTSKGRGKRGRGGNNSTNDISNFTDTRNCVQSKLRNGKGRRTTLNSNASSSGFTVPNSPAKSDSGSSGSKRKGRPADLEISTPPTDTKSSKRSRTQKNAAPTSTSTASAEISQPSSPNLIVCPQPNCSKKYKHINGLKYHQMHAHSGSDSSKMDDNTTEDSKDVTNSSDNEESMQESTSVSTSPTPSFTNTVPSSAKSLLNGENASSSSSSANGLPESDPYSLTTDLSTLASVAISDSKSGSKSNNASRPSPLSGVSQDVSVINSDGDNSVSAPVLPVPVTNPSPDSTSLSHSPVLSSASVSLPGGPVLSPAVSAVTTSVIQSSNAVDNSSSQALGVNIPTSHVIFSQGILGSNSTTACTYATSTVVCSNSSSLSPSKSNLSSNVTSTYSAIPSIASTIPSTASIPLIDKNKIKQERPDKYKPKSPLATPPIRPIVPAPTQLIGLASNMPSSHPGINVGGHSPLNSPLKPIQPKPTILGEPTTVNPALECLKKEKSKHKKKNKDKDKERDKKISALPLLPTKLGGNPGEECEALELTTYPSLEAVPVALPSASHVAMSPLMPQSKPPETLDMSLPEDTINENVQSPAYSDISDANDTAPVLESEVAAGKEKEDKVGKATPDAAQSPATNISAYGAMYPYYSNPPYLLPSVSPQNAVGGASQGQGLLEKSEMSKKVDQDRIKENRPWSNPSGDSRDRQHLDPHESEKKLIRDDGVQGSTSSPAAAGVPVQEYPIQQHYPYSYGYVQGYPYAVETSPYHMHMLDSDPHYKQQYKQYLDEQHRLYKEQQHQQQQQHLQQQQQQQHHQQSVQHHPHQQHHSQHQSHHSSKSHHSSMKEERDRSRESKDRSGSIDKLSSSGLIVEHSSKIQHSSMSLIANKDQDVREIDTRPPSLPAQARIDSSNSASAVALKEKQNENHQILKENIELKSQMDDSKNKINQYEMAMLYERHREDMRRFYMYQDRVIEQQQQKMEPGIHHHTHHHQTIQSSHSHLQATAYSSSSSLKSLKDDLPSSIPSHAKSNHYGDNTRPSVVSPAKSDHIKNPHSNSTSSPKGSIRDRDSSHGSSKEYMSSSSGSGSSKKDGSKSSERSESSNRDDKKSDKIKQEPKVESEGQKPTMETTGPPPPPTNSYAYLHPSYLQPPPPHFPHMPFEPAHAMYRGAINPMIVSAPHYGSSPYVHPQIRYVTPGACEIPAHPHQPESINSKLHPAGPSKALDLLQQVSQHYTTTHKIHELSEHALMSPTPTSGAPTTPSTSSNSSSGKGSSSEPTAPASKVDVAGSRDASRSPPTQRHLHTHHHTHVGVGYPIYDPYGVAAQKTYT